MQIIVRRFGKVRGYTDEFVEALHQLNKERGGGSILVSDIEARAATIKVVEPAPKLPPLPMPKLPPLPLPRIPK